MKTNITQQYHPMSKNPVIKCGKCLVQQSEGGFFVLTPDSKASFQTDKDKAKSVCAEWFKAHCPNGEISLGEIQWHFNATQHTAEILQAV